MIRACVSRKVYVTNDYGTRAILSTVWVCAYTDTYTNACERAREWVLRERRSMCVCMNLLSVMWVRGHYFDVCVTSWSTCSVRYYTCICFWAFCWAGLAAIIVIACIKWGHKIYKQYFYCDPNNFTSITVFRIKIILWQIQVCMCFHEHVNKL